MALDKSIRSGNAKPGATPESPNTSPESDMAMLASLLTQQQARDGPPEANSDTDDPQVPELLNRLIAADGVAKGVEERLDGIIENLDLLLATLEKESPDEKPVDATVSDNSPEGAQSP